MPRQGRFGAGEKSVPPAPARRGGRTGLPAKHNSITHRPINNRYQLLLWASIINTPYSNYTIIIMMNNLLVEIGLALQRQICKRAGNVGWLQWVYPNMTTPPSPDHCHCHEKGDPLQHLPPPHSLQVLPTLSFPVWLHYLQKSAIYQHVGSLGGVRGGGGCGLTLSSPNPSRKDMLELGRCPQPLPRPLPTGSPACQQPQREQDPGAGASPSDPAQTRICAHIPICMYICIYIFKNTYVHIYTHMHIYVANECPRMLPHTCPPTEFPQPSYRPGPAPAAVAQGGGPRAPGGRTEPCGLGPKH